MAFGLRQAPLYLKHQVAGRDPKSSRHLQNDKQSRLTLTTLDPAEVRAFDVRSKRQSFL